MEVVVYGIRFADGSVYVGMSADLPRRLQEHARRQSPSTRRMLGDFQLLYSKAFTSYTEARRHEKFMKSGAGRKLLQSSVTA